MDENNTLWVISYGFHSTAEYWNGEEWDNLSNAKVYTREEISKIPFSDRPRGGCFVSLPSGLIKADK